MKIRELIRYSNRLLRGRRAGTMMICILPLGAELFFRFAEAAVYSLLLYFGSLPPIRLFGGDEPLQLAVTTVSTVLRCVTVAPLTYAAAYRLYGMTGERPCRKACSLSRILLRKCTLKRSISAALWTKAVSLLALAPAIFFGVSAYGMIHEKMYADEAFIAANMVFLAAVSVFMWLSLKLSFSAVPYLLVRFPKLTAYRAMVFSVRFMRGRKSVFLRLLTVYLPQMLTIAGLPYGLTKLMTAFSLSIDIFIKEDEYLEADRAESGRRKARNTGKIPHRSKRRVKAAADKA
ncbi:MAG: hypothetical protein IKW96_01630 [Ruminococcus sp.]|uniref:hypothetical protein n=1 Tax=Ruminococcus sp. TaxID=41978 RepID=UPI0025DC9090|nr:hypothetical protein [Ruminococcus sp.]MBR5681968.1 hypothetical protein [Ruminococcus sp.]